MDAALQRVRVWDLPTRVFHWTLAAAVSGSVITANLGGNAMAWHFRLGYLVLALLAFRIVWGLVGGRWSRFSSFWPTPGRLLRYLRGTPRPGELLDVGHSPLGALSVFALLGLLLAQVATGLVADDEIANQGPLYRFVAGATSHAATAWHKGAGEALLLALVALHVAAVLAYLFAKERNLIGPMWRGDKELPASVPASADGRGPRLLAAAVAVACAAGVAWLVSLGG